MARVRHLLKGAEGPETLCGAPMDPEAGPGWEVCPECLAISLEQAAETFRKPRPVPEPPVRGPDFMVDPPSE